MVVISGIGNVLVGGMRYIPDTHVFIDIMKAFEIECFSYIKVKPAVLKGRSHLAGTRRG